MGEEETIHIKYFDRLFRILICIIVLSLPLTIRAQHTDIDAWMETRPVIHPISETLADMWMAKAENYNIYDEEQLTYRTGCYEQAAFLLKGAGNTLKEAMALQRLGDCYNHRGWLQPARTTLENSLVLYRQGSYRQLQGVYNLLGNVLDQMGDYDKALQYGFLAAQTAEEQHDSSTLLCTIYNRLGLTYYHLTDYQHALHYFQQSMAVAVKCKDTTAILTLGPNIANSFQRLGKPENAVRVLEDMREQYPITSNEDRITLAAGFAGSYVRMEQYEEAAKYIQQLEELSKNFSASNYMQDVVFAAMLNYYLSTEQYHQVYRYGKAYKEYCEEGGYIHELLNDYLYLFKADSALGRSLAAIDWYQQYKMLNDSLYGEAKSRQIAQLQVKYETERKDHAIRLKDQDIRLLEEQGRLQQAALSHTRLTGSMITGGAILLVILLIMGYNRYQMKRAIHRQLQAQRRAINEQNEALHTLLLTQRTLLEEKQWLVKEIHHRVKNNLQTITSLLHTQTAYLDNTVAAKVIRESRSRMQAISLIHQKLFLSEGRSAVDMQLYTQELIAYFRDSFVYTPQISFQLEIAPILLDVVQVVPVGLILNEALTNALKYAFTEKEEGTITVSLHCTLGEYLLLTIKDDGKGLPPDFEKNKHSSMGLLLMETLSEQLDGSLSVKGGKGTTVMLIFKPQHAGTSTPEIKNVLNKTA